MFRIVLFGLSLACVACSRDVASASSPPVAATIEVASRIPSLRIVATDVLPVAPSAQPLEENCKNQVIAPTSEGARLAAFRGWHVAGDQPFGRYRAVAIFKAASDGTSGSCIINDGSVLVFDGGALIAIAYDPQVEPDGESDVGSLTATVAPDRLRLWPGSPGAPVGDLVQTKAGIEIVPFPASEPACGGKLPVPVIYGQDIIGARRKLLDAGWKPILQKDLDTYAPASTLRERGVVEVDTCSGTGFGYCGFGYRHPDGAELGVTTIGEDFIVAGYGVVCADGSQVSF